MPKYINRDDLFDKLLESNGWWVSKAQQIILDMPDADAVPVRHGRWINISLCSACGRSTTSPSVDRWRYCPACGAKMERG